MSDQKKKSKKKELKKNLPKIKVRVDQVEQVILNSCQECGNENQSEFNRDFEILTLNQEVPNISIRCKKCGAKEPLENLVLQCEEIEKSLVTEKLEVKNI
jgi:hypothetical protein